MWVIKTDVIMDRQESSEVTKLQKCQCSRMRFVISRKLFFTSVWLHFVTDSCHAGQMADYDYYHVKWERLAAGHITESGGKENWFLFIWLALVKQFCLSSILKYATDDALEKVGRSSFQTWVATAKAQLLLIADRHIWGTESAGELQYLRMPQWETSVTLSSS